LFIIERLLETKRYNTRGHNRQNGKGGRITFITLLHFGFGDIKMVLLTLKGWTLNGVGDIEMVWFRWH